MARILVVDNEPSSRGFLRLHLESAGHQVFFADDTSSGVRLALMTRPDLILCATGKPGMDGLKVVSGVRANEQTAATPMILFSPDGEREMIRQALAQGADDYLVQPLSGDELVYKVGFRLRRQEAGRDLRASSAPGAAMAKLGAASDAVLAAPPTDDMTVTGGLTARSVGYVGPIPAPASDAPQEVRHGTVLFSDIRNFSTLTEALSAAEVAEVLNGYFAHACEPILQQGGWIVKLLGDGVLALFEPLAGNPHDHAQRALRAALFQVIVAQRFNTWLLRRFPDRQLPEFAVGIGVHTGEAVVVRVNTGAGVDTTIIGDTVNVASRLEQQTKKLAASVVTTLDTLQLAGSRFIPGKRGSLLVRGRTAPVEITEILGLRPRQSADIRTLQTYATIREAVAKNAAMILRLRDEVLSEPHRFRTTEQFTPLRPADAPIKIPDYRLVRRLGRGGVSRAFLAEYEPAGALRVLKVLNIDDGGYELLQRFLQEYDIISQVRHPNVAAIYGQGRTENHAYIVMEYFAGGELRQRIETALPPALALDYARQATQALVEIHAHGILHRDLKPDNFMLREDGTLVLADFAIAKNLASSLNQTRHGEALGTPYYLSPEQALGKKLDQRCDLYSLGVMLFEMLAGEPPYTGENPPQVVSKHVHAPLPRLPSHLESLQPLIDTLMAKQPEDRFGSAEEALKAICGQLDAMDVSADPEDCGNLTLDLGSARIGTQP